MVASMAIRSKGGPMAIKKQYDATVPTQMTSEWKARVKAVADHERINDSLSAVIRDCIEVALPGFERELGIRTLDDLSEGELEALGLNRLAEEAEKPTVTGREDRARGSFGYSEVVRPEG